MLSIVQYIPPQHMTSSTGVTAAFSSFFSYRKFVNCANRCNVLTYSVYSVCSIYSVCSYSGKAPLLITQYRKPLRSSCLSPSICRQDLSEACLDLSRHHHGTQMKMSVQCVHKSVSNFDPNLEHTDQSASLDSPMRVHGEALTYRTGP